jgi:outer membrane protein
MRMRRRVLAAIGCALHAGVAWAQTAPVRVMEFDDAVKQAIERNPDVALAATAIARAEALLQQARSATQPFVTASVNNTTLDSSRGFEGATTQPQNQTVLSANASVPILAAGRRAQVDQARDQIEIARFSAADSRRLIGVAAAQAYLGVIAARRQVDVNTRALESARAHLDYASRRLEGGAGSRLNQLRAAQQVSADEARLETSRFALTRSQDALRVIIVADGPVDAGAEPALDLPASIDEAAWMAARPDLQGQAAAIRAAERVVRDWSKDWLPSASVSFQPQFVTPSGLFAPSRSWSLGVLVTQRVFDPARKADKALRSVSLSQATFARTATEIAARSEVRLAQEAVATTDRVLTSTRLSADQAAEVLKITTAAFEVGATTNIEVIDAQRQARDAATLVTIAEDAVRRARLDVLVAIGRFPR